MTGTAIQIQPIQFMSCSFLHNENACEMLVTAYTDPHQQCTVRGLYITKESVCLCADWTCQHSKNAAQMGPGNISIRLEQKVKNVFNIILLQKKKKKEKSVLCHEVTEHSVFE